MGVLVNIDNGSTTADAGNRERVVHARFPTTPQNLTQHFVAALTRISRELYGEENLACFLLQHGASEADIRVRIELDLRHGNQSVRTGIVCPFRPPQSASRLVELLNTFSHNIARPSGDDSPPPEGSWQISVVRVVSYVEHQRPDLQPACEDATTNAARIDPVTQAVAASTRIYRHTSIEPGTIVEGPALVESPHTTYLVEPGWTLTMGHMGSGVLQQRTTDAAEAQADSRSVMTAAA